jgi:hypothetical protein
MVIRMAAELCWWNKVCVLREQQQSRQDSFRHVLWALLCGVHLDFWEPCAARWRPSRIGWRTAASVFWRWPYAKVKCFAVEMCTGNTSNTRLRRPQQKGTSRTGYLKNVLIYLTGAYQSTSTALRLVQMIFGFEDCDVSSAIISSFTPFVSSYFNPFPPPTWRSIKLPFLNWTFIGCVTISLVKLKEGYRHALGKPCLRRSSCLTVEMTLAPVFFAKRMKVEY